MQVPTLTLICMQSTQRALFVGDRIHNGNSYSYSSYGVPTSYKESINPLWPFPSQPWGGVSISGCVCDRGYIRVNDSCILCAAGKYKAAWGTGGCLNCSSAQYSRSSRSGCADCPAGKMSTQKRGAEDTACVECEAGKYKYSTYTWFPDLNAFQAYGNTVCEACPRDTYQPHNTSTTCFFCPRGKSGDGTRNATSEASGCSVYCDPEFVNWRTSQPTGVYCQPSSASNGAPGTVSCRLWSPVYWRFPWRPYQHRNFIKLASCEPCEAGKYSSTYAYHGALGLKWLNIGNETPTGGEFNAIRIDNSRLALALEHKTEFTRTEWEAFQVDLRPTSSSQSFVYYIYSLGSYFIPDDSGLLNHSSWETLSNACLECPDKTNSLPASWNVTDCMCNR